MVALDDLSLFQRILLFTDGTVTDLIALYAGEPIHVRKLRQALAVREAPPLLAADGPIRVLERCILLSGRERNYLYAESHFIFERFSASIQRQLLESDKPIGLMWKEERLETYREITAQAVVQRAELTSYFQLPATAWFVSRTYLIHHGGRPLGTITEQWPVDSFT